MKVAVEISDAYDLMPKDGQGSASPYVEVNFAGQRQRTQTKLKDLSPSWNETLLFNVTDPADLPNCTIEVSVYHHGSHAYAPADFHGAGGEGTTTRGGRSRNYFLGRVRISGASIARCEEEASLQRCPLEKRGLFSNIRGEVALRVYAIPDYSSPPAAGDPLPPSNGNPGYTPAANIFTAAPSEAETMARGSSIAGVNEGAGGAFRSLETEQRQGILKRERKHQRPSHWPPEPSPAAMQMQPPGTKPELGLVETAPPLACRAGLHHNAGYKIASTYDLVEQMTFLFVNVVKARDLPAMDLTGSLDPYVEVRLGNYEGRTMCLEKNQNPEWRQVFAFAQEHLQADYLEVLVKDKDFLRDDFVGRVSLELEEVPARVPPDSPLAPQWYRLVDKKGEMAARGEVMLAVWLGTQADEAFQDAWHSDALSVSGEGLVHTRSKVYFSPRLCYLRVEAIEAQDLVPSDAARVAPDVYVEMQLGGNQKQRSKPSAATRSVNPVWKEEFIFAVSEPFDDPLVVTVVDHVGPGKDDILGRILIPMTRARPRPDRNRPPLPPEWFDLKPSSFFSSPDEPTDNVSRDNVSREHMFTSKIQLQLCLEDGYHVLDESIHHSSDFRPFARHLLLKQQPIGVFELGIRSARKLAPMKKASINNGYTTDAYCVAKYGPKWVRTRTILNSLDPLWHEQYSWEVFDPCTVITVAVFDNCHLKDTAAKDQRIGKVRIRLSTLEANRVYTHYYPLLVLQRSGLKKTGELHLALRFTCTSWINMMNLYIRPMLPKMHYLQPILVRETERLRYHAIQIFAARLSRAEPPLRREAVEYMLDVDSHMWSLRRSKANFNRIVSLLSGVVAVGDWFYGVRYWNNPVTTVLVHILFLIVVWNPGLILPTVFLYMFMIGVWNYRFRPRHPPHMDARLSHADLAHPHELDEELDTWPTSRPMDDVRRRYDQLRSIAGRLQTVVGDVANQGERAHALLSWRDPRATFIFLGFSLLCTVVLYVMPFQAIVTAAGLYALRHPRFRRWTPSVHHNFFRRLPSKSDVLL